MKKIILYILFFVFFVYLIIVTTFVANKLDVMKCNRLTVSVKNKEFGVFVDDSYIKNVVNSKFPSLIGSKISEIDKSKIESILSKHSLLKSTCVYNDLNGSLHIEVEQRYPLFRVIGDNDRFYVDNLGVIMDMPYYTPVRVPVVTGKVSKTFASDVFLPFMLWVDKNDYWKSFIEQIFINDKEEITLIPNLGDFKVIMGKYDNSFVKKLDKLKVFMTWGKNLDVWNKYKEINLKFENQIVCVKK